MKPEIKFPTIIGLILLLASTVGALILTNSRAIFRSNATTDCTPINAQASNLTATSGSIFFLTEADCQANIKIDNRTVGDARQPASGNYPATKVHYFQINNLKGSTTYPYQIISGGQTYEGEDFQITTSIAPASAAPSSNLAWGKVVTPSLSPAPGSIVFLNIPGASLISAIVTSNGYWNIPLSTSFNDSLDAWFTPPSEAVDEEILVFSTSATITQLTSKTSNNNPVPDIILGQNYFNENNLNVGAGQLPTATPTSASQNNPATGTGKLTISSPKEGERLATQSPEIFGTANPGDKITIRLSSSAIVDGQTYATSNGSWTWHHTSALAAGTYALTVTASGTATLTSTTQSRQFSIIPQSDGLAFTASESGNLTTPTLIPTLEPTAYPTEIPTPTAKPTATRVSHPSTQSGVPTTGTSLPGILLVISSAIFITISLLFYRQSANFK